MKIAKHTTDPNGASEPPSAALVDCLSFMIPIQQIATKIANSVLRLIGSLRHTLSKIATEMALRQIISSRLQPQLSKSDKFRQHENQPVPDRQNRPERRLRRSNVTKIDPSEKITKPEKADKLNDL